MDAYANPTPSSVQDELAEWLIDAIRWAATIDQLDELERAISQPPVDHWRTLGVWISERRKLLEQMELGEPTPLIPLSIIHQAGCLHSCEDLACSCRPSIQCVDDDGRVYVVAATDLLRPRP